jgi:hypothetical protein
MSKKPPINFSKSFNLSVARNAKVWEDRQSTVGASEIFGCIRSVFASRMCKDEIDQDQNEDDPEWGHAERGNLIENDFAVPNLKSIFGEDNCFYMGKDQKTFKDGRLSATPDGLVVGLSEDALSLYNIPSITGECIATEIKTFGGPFAEPKKIKHDDGSITYEARIKHIGQNIVQMGTIAKNTNYSPTTGVVLYFNPVNLKDMRVCTVAFSQSVYDNAKARAESIYVPGKRISDFPAEGLRTEKGCDYCKFVGLCRRTEAEMLPQEKKKTKDLPEEIVKAVEEKVRLVYKLKADSKQIEDSKKSAEQDLKELLQKNGTFGLKGSDWSVSITKSKGRSTLDREAMRDDGIELENYMKEGNPFTVTRIKVD